MFVKKSLWIYFLSFIVILCDLQTCGHCRQEDNHCAVGNDHGQLLQEAIKPSLDLVLREEEEYEQPEVVRRLIESPGGCSVFLSSYLLPTGESSITVFGVKAEASAEIKLLDTTHSKTFAISLHMKKFGGESYMDAQGLDQQLVIVSRRSIHLNRNKYTWFSIFRKENLIALYQARNPTPALVYQDINNNKLNFLDFDTFQVASCSKGSWDFIGHNFQTSNQGVYPEDPALVSEIEGVKTALSTRMLWAARYDKVSQYAYQFAFTEGINEIIETIDSYKSILKYYGLQVPEVSVEAVDNWIAQMTDTRVVVTKQKSSRKPQPEVKRKPKPETEQKTEPEVKPISQPEAKTKPQPEVEPVLQPEAKTKPQPEVEPVLQPEAKTKPQPEVEQVLQPDVKRKPKPEFKPKPQPEVKKKSQPSTSKPVPVPAPLPRPKPAPLPRPKPAPLPKPEPPPSKPEPTPEPTPTRKFSLPKGCVTTEHLLYDPKTKEKTVQPVRDCPIVDEMPLKANPEWGEVQCEFKVVKKFFPHTQRMRAERRRVCKLNTRKFTK